MKSRRVVKLVKEEPEEEGGRPRLRAYGRAALAKLAGCTVNEVKNAIRRRDFDPDSLASSIVWVHEWKRTHPEPKPPPSNGSDPIEPPAA